MLQNFKIKSVFLSLQKQLFVVSDQNDFIVFTSFSVIGMLKNQQEREELSFQSCKRSLQLYLSWMLHVWKPLLQDT